MVMRWLGVMLVLGCCLLPTAATGQGVDINEVESKTISPTTPTHGATSPELANTIQDIINATNRFRQVEGLREVKPNPQLMAAAHDFATFMARTGTYGHSADGRSPAERAKQHGYDPCIISENIAYQYRTSGFTSAELARALFEGWKHSSDHRKNMLDPAVTETGVGVARSERTGYYYAVQMFGHPTTEMMEFQITNQTDTPISYTMDGHTFPLPPRSTRTHQQCQPAEIIVHWPGTQEQITVRPQHEDQYTIVQEANGRFTVQKA
jgi:uncharacterized protein YkwD